MLDRRPDPDALLGRVKDEEAHARKGRLKVFLGAAPGVGKTYAMLEAAHQRRAEGVDAAIGWVDTHGRAETEALVAGLERLPTRELAYRTVTLREFDLDGALARRPALLLVDELAHTNAPGVRHPKRWQDVAELLDAGINVYTTLNIQHLESLNDLVAKITGVTVQETVPDAVLDEADEVSLVDLPPDELLGRLRDGKVYVPANAEAAMRSFFRTGNLTALRELALRRTADRVDLSVRGYMRNHAIGRTWPVAERLLVSVSPSPDSPRVVRAAKRMATALRAEWIAAYVEVPGARPLPEADRARTLETLRLAEQLGAETVTLTGARITEELLAFARARNVSQIVIGKPQRPLWRRLISGSIADALIRGSGEIDVHVISGEGERARPPRRIGPPHGIPWAEYALAVLTVALSTGVAWPMFHHFDLANLIMVYLLGVVAVSTRCGLGPSVLASVLSVAAFDVFFVPPYFSFAVTDTQYLVTFAVMLLVAVVLSGLAGRLRAQAAVARLRERRTAALYAMTRDLASARGTEVLEVAMRHIAEVFRCQAVALLPDARGELTCQVGARPFTLDATDVGASQWVFERGQAAGPGTDTLAAASALFVPLRASRGTVGVLGIRGGEPLGGPELTHLLETFVGQTALAYERTLLAAEAQRAHVRVEHEQLRNTLLSSVSHDLRTPLASAMGAISSLLEQEELEPATRRELLQSVYEELERLNRLVGNLLDMMRLESGAVTVQREWHPIEDVVASALTHLERRLRGRAVAVDVPATLPLARLDGVLIEQVLVNLLDNALKYAPPESPIAIAAAAGEGSIEVAVSDRGPGIPPGEEERLFEKFYRSQPTTARGVGLGLAICRAIVDAHGGRIWAESRPGGGASFRFTLPAGEQPEVPDAA